MKKLVEIKTGKVSFGDALAIAAIKPVTERIYKLIPYVGNGNYVSAAVKVISAVALMALAGKYKLANYTGAALTIDGTEDLVYAISRSIGLFKNGNSDI